MYLIVRQVKLGVLLLMGSEKAEKNIIQNAHFRRKLFISKWNGKENTIEKIRNLGNPIPKNKDLRDNSKNQLLLEKDFGYTPSRFLDLD